MPWLMALQISWGFKPKSWWSTWGSTKFEVGGQSWWSNEKCRHMVFRHMTFLNGACMFKHSLFVSYNVHVSCQYEL